MNTHSSSAAGVLEAWVYIYIVNKLDVINFLFKFPAASDISDEKRKA